MGGRPRRRSAAQGHTPQVSADGARRRRAQMERSDGGRGRPCWVRSLPTLLCAPKPELSAVSTVIPLRVTAQGQVPASPEHPASSPESSAPARGSRSSRADRVSNAQGGGSCRRGDGVHGAHRESRSRGVLDSSLCRACTPRARRAPRDTKREGEPERRHLFKRAALCSHASRGGRC